MPKSYLDYMLDMPYGVYYVDSLEIYQLEELLESKQDTARVLRQLIERVVALEDKLEDMEAENDG